MAHTETYHSVGNGGRMCRKTNNRFLHIGPNIEGIICYFIGTQFCYYLLDHMALKD